MKRPLDFGGMLKAHLNRGKSLEEWGNLLGTGKGQLANLISGRRSMNISRARPWAKLLRLDTVETQRFVRLAAITHIPDQQARHAFVAMVYELENVQALARRLDA